MMRLPVPMEHLCRDTLTALAVFLSRCAGPADVRHLSFPPGERPEVHLRITGEFLQSEALTRTVKKLKLNKSFFHKMNTFFS